MGAERTRFDLVSFDLDGTLVDTAAEIAEAANRTIEEFGLERQPVGAVARFIGAGTHELMRRLLGSLGGLPGQGNDGDLGAVFERFAVHYATTAGTTCTLYPGCVEALARLRTGGVRLACLTNKEERYSRLVLEAMGLGQAFEIVVGGDTLRFKKPDPRVVGHIAGALGVSLGAMLHVGDSRTDVETARNAGIAAWAVPYGYNGGKPVAASRPDRMVATLGLVADAVLSARALAG